MNERFVSNITGDTIFSTRSSQGFRSRKSHTCQCDCRNTELFLEVKNNSRPDYMANFSLDNRVETSARLLQQILLKSNCRLHGEGFSPRRNSAQGENPSPVCSNRAMIFSPGKQPENQKKSHVIETEFQPGLKSRKQYGYRYEAEAISVEFRQ